MTGLAEQEGGSFSLKIAWFQDLQSSKNLTMIASTNTQFEYRISGQQGRDVKRDNDKGSRVYLQTRNEHWFVHL